jgi:predicted site-specific integrase-resolvase
MDETQKKNETQKKMLYKEVESSEILGISYAYLKVLRRKGLISWVQVGRSVRYRMSDLQRYVERNLKIADVENSL